MRLRGGGEAGEFFCKAENFSVEKKFSGLNVKIGFRSKGNLQQASDTLIL